jgi:hypothetical protein
MHTGRSIQQAALVVSSLAALFAGSDTLGPVSYAAVATVLLALTSIVKMADAKAHDTRTLAQLVAETDVTAIEGRVFERRRA